MTEEQLERYLHSLIGEGTPGFKIAAIEKMATHYDVVLDYGRLVGEESSELLRKPTKVRWSEEKKTLYMQFEQDLSIGPALQETVVEALKSFKRSRPELSLSVNDHGDTLSLLVSTGIEVGADFSRKMRRRLTGYVVLLVFLLQTEWHHASQHIFAKMGLDPLHGVPKPN